MKPDISLCNRFTVGRRAAAALLALLACLSLLPASAESPYDDRSPNLTHLANIGYEVGTDLAFFDHYAIAGAIGNADAGFRIIDIADPAKPKVVGHFKCLGSQNDVAVLGSIVVMSVDGRRQSTKCDAPSGGTTEGVRIVDISNLARPKQIAFVQTSCGSHTHTLVPDTANGRVLVYVASGAPGYRTEATNGPDPKCNRASHGLSVVSVPLDRPAAAKVVSTSPIPKEGPPELASVGCHDITVFLERKLAAGACLDESQIWDISDPLKPKMLSRIPTDALRPIDIHHSAGFSWDGKTLVIGDEAGGYSGPACISGHDPLGALWFFDITDPRNPVQKGYFSLPRPRVYACTAHNYNIVPVQGRNILVGGFYTGGITVVDFTDPSAPQEIGHYWNFGPALRNQYGVEAGSEVWSAYWYNGHIYGSDLGRGLDVFALDDPMTATALRLDRMNPQTQEALLRPAPSSPQPVKVLGGRLAATGGGRAQAVAGPSLVVLAALLAAGAGAPSLRRGVRGR